MSSEAPEGWVATNIGSLFAMSTPGHWGEEGADGGNILVLRSANFLKSGGLNYETAALRKFDAKKLVQKRLKSGDILLERSGGSPAQPVGRVNRFDAEGDFSASNFLQILRARDEVDEWFAYFLLDSFYARGGTENLQKATTGIRNLDFATYLASPILLPPLDEQRRIAEVLRSLDTVVTSSASVCGQARALLNAARIEVAASNSVKRRLGDVCHVIGGYAFKSEAFSDEGIKVLRISNITDAGVQFGERTAHVREADLRGLDRFLLKNGDALIALSGATTGKTCVFNFDETTYVNQRVAYVRVKDKKETDQSYVNHVTSSLVDSIRLAAYGGAQPNISTKDISDIQVPIPTFVEQKAVADVLNWTQSAMVTGEAAWDSVSEIKKRVTADLLSGHVRVPA